jgi:hypothetical protein
MQMAAINSTLLPSTMVQLTSGASPTVPLHFNLSRIYDNQAVADFAWKHDAFIYGELPRWGPGSFNCLAGMVV